MKRLFEDYVIEMLIILVGMVAGLVEVFVVGDNNLAAVLIVMSFLMSLTALSVRREVSDQIAQQWELPQLIEQIPSEHWRSEAKEDLQRFKLELHRWTTGVRNIPRQECIAFEIDLLRRATTSIQGIHIGAPVGSLYLWDKDRGGFSQFIKANQRLAARVSKRRIFVCNNEDLLTADGKVLDERALRIFRRQVQSTDKGGLGVDVRILWTDTLHKAGGQMPPNLLIVDNKETVVIKGAEHIYMDVEAITNVTLVRTYQRLFESCWEIAESVTNYLHKG